MSNTRIVPGIDAAIGIHVYGTLFAGLGSGYGIREKHGDFAVREILSPAAIKSLSDYDVHNDNNCNDPAKTDSKHNGASGANQTGDSDSNSFGGVATTTTNATVAAAGRGLPGMYGVYILAKRGIDTAHALDAVRKMTGAKLKPLGLKDASAVTEQYVCSTGAGRRLSDIKTARFDLRFAGYAKKPLTKKQMLGNRFQIKISGRWGHAVNDACCDGSNTCANPADFNEFDNVPNFYGYQRFGSRRPVTHLVGRAIVMRDFDEAIRLILEFDSEYDTPERREMRQNLADPALYEQSAARLPAGMDTEKTVLAQLARHKNSLCALQAIPLSLRRLYVSAYQSYVFNRTLSAAIKQGEDLLNAASSDVCFDRSGNLSKFERVRDASYNAARAGGQQIRGRQNDNSMLRTRAASVAVPIVGYSYYSKTRFDPYVSDVLEDEECVRPRDFFIKEMQEASGEGGFRDALLHCADYCWDAEKHTAAFSLVRGSFATMLLREIIKPPDPIAAGF